MSDSTSNVDSPKENAPANHSSRARRGVATEITGFGLNSLIRLGSNLILTRLLFPEVFGLMAMMQVVIYGLWMLSDVGLAQGVIANARGDDDDFLNTAWTMQVIRGCSLWLIGCLLAWPVSYLMREPRLLWMLPIGTLTSMIHGFSSTRVFTLRRRLHLLPLMLLDLLTQIVGLVVNVAGALRGYGVEALLAGQIISVLVFTAVSHNLPGVSHRDRLRMEPEARHQLMHFGRWIFFSSALSFGSSRADQIILARLLGAAPLGLYNIALNLGEMPGTLFLRLISGVAYPSLARVKNQRPGDFATEYYRLRLWLDVCFYTGAGVLVAISDILIRVLYDDRWQGAAMMLRIIIVRTALSAVGAVVEAGLMAHGKAEYAFRKNAVSTACLLVFMPIGSHFGGVQGVLWASVAATGASLCVLWPAALRLGFFRLHRELVLFVYLGIGYGVGLGVSGVLGSLLALLRVALRSWLHR